MAPRATSTRGTAPNAVICCHQPANRSSARRLGISTAESQRAYPVTIVSAGNCLAVRVWLMRLPWWHVHVRGECLDLKQVDRAARSRDRSELAVSNQRANIIGGAT